MSKTGPIAHAPNTPLVIIRKDYLDLCEGDHCAAAILNVFEYWHGVKMAQAEQTAIEANIAAVGGVKVAPSDAWVWKSIPAIQDDLLGLFGERKVSAALAALTAKGYLSSRNNPNYGWDRTLQYQFNVDAIQAGLDNLPSRKNAASKPQKRGIVDAKMPHQSREFAAAIPETTTESQIQDITYVPQAGGIEDHTDPLPLQWLNESQEEAYEGEKDATPLIPDLVYEDLETPKKPRSRFAKPVKEKNASQKEVKKKQTSSAGINSIIGAYVKSTGIIMANPYADTALRAVAKALDNAGITAADVSTYVAEKIVPDVFWRDKVVTLKYIASGIGRWKEERVVESEEESESEVYIVLAGEQNKKFDELEEKYDAYK